MYKRDEFFFSFLSPQGGRDAKFEQVYKLENGVVEFLVSFCMLRSCRDAVFALEDVFGEEESHLKMVRMNTNSTLFLFFFQLKGIFFSMSFVHLDLWLEHVLSLELEIIK